PGSLGRPGEAGRGTAVIRDFPGIIELASMVKLLSSQFNQSADAAMTAVTLRRPLTRAGLRLGLAAGLLAALAGCGDDAATQETARPAWVVQASTQGAAPTAYAGEVRARFEPALAFRIGGKISKRFVDVGARVKKDQP